MKIKMLGKLTSLALALGLMGALTACQHTATTAPTAQSFQLQLDQQHVELKSVPQKLAVYDLAALDTLQALGIKASIVPQSSYSGALAAYAADDIVKAGSLFEPDINTLQQAQPDLIVVGGRSAAQVEKLTAIAPVINFTAQESGTVLETLAKRTHSFAQAFGKTQQANAQLTEIKQLQSQLKQQTQGKSALMLFAVGDHFMPHAENERFGFVYEFAGFTPAIPVAEISNAPRPEAGSPEALALQQKNAQRLQQAVAQQPDYLIVLDRGAVNTQTYASKDNILKHPVLSQSKAVKEGRVIFVDANRWYLIGLGLHNSKDMLQELIQATQP